MTAPDYSKQPWKHPVNWKAHVVSMTREIIDGVDHCVARCECSWSTTAALGTKQQGYVTRDDAIHAHWADNIAAAGRTPA